MKLPITLAFIFLCIVADAQTCFNQQQLCFQFISPKPGSAMHHINSRIVFRHGELLDISGIEQNASLVSVQGMQSGLHTCNVWLASDGKTMQVDPLTDFALNELVEVNIGGLRLSANNELLDAISFSFTTSSQMPPSYGPFPVEEEVEEGDRDYPNITELININPAPGNIFMNTTGMAKFNAILDSAGGGVPLWFEEGDDTGNDFKPNENGLITYFNRIPQTWSVMNEFTQLVDILEMLNGYLCDDHECMYYPDGHYYLQCYDHQFYDMSQWVPGGNPAADVTGYVWQEIDENDDLIMQWRTWDYFEPTENEHLDLTGYDLDLWHGNSIERDAEGNIHISFRNIDEITKIDGQTGDIIWRLGNGIMNQFSFLNDDGFTFQHDARKLDNGHFTVYNNGNYNNPQRSSCVEYEVNENTMTVNKVWEYTHPENLFAPSMGGCRRLDGGHTFINWGNVVNDDWGARVTEVDENSTIVLEYGFDFGYNTYRAFKDEWFFDDSVIGCTDPAAINFNPNAPIINDVFCQYDEDNDGFSPEMGDCDDGNNELFPGAEEIINDGIDQDCDGEDLIVEVVDIDEDGFDNLTDCNDADDSIYPGAEEIPYDAIDQDCTDGDLVDVDNDGVNGPDDDCNDTDDSIYPGAEEIPYDAIDQDCTDGDLVDVDNDGFSGIDEDCNDLEESIYPGAIEIANDGIDQDCIGGDLIIGVDESAASFITLYPLPAHHSFYITSPIEVATLDLLDAGGKLILTIQHFHSTEINCAQWSSGTYHLSFELQTGEKFQKVLLVK